MKLVTGLAAALLLVLPAFASAQHEHAEPGGDQVGSDSVSFVTSCAPALRQDFNRAVALLHSFWFAQAIAAFDGVAAKDPSCAIAHWGVALSRWGNPFAGLRSPQQIELGRAAIQTRAAPRAPQPRASAHTSPRPPSCLRATTPRPSARAPSPTSRAWNGSFANFRATWRRASSTPSR